MLPMYVIGIISWIKHPSKKNKNEVEIWEDGMRTDGSKGTYEWYRRSADGTILDTSSAWKTGKVVYVDSTVIDGKIIIDCKFTM